MSAKQARADLGGALTTVQDIRYQPDFGSKVDPPSTQVGPPALIWEAHCDAPTSARVTVFLIVAAEERAVDSLLDLLPVVTEAIESVPDAVVVEATPGAFNAGGIELPCYAITTEVAI